MPQIHRFLSLAALALILAACGDGEPPTQPPAGPEPGVLRFNYSGALTGEFRSKGDPRGGGRTVAYALTTAAVDEIPTVYIIGNYFPNEGRAFDDFIIEVQNPKVGTVTCATMTNCPVVHGDVLLNATHPGSGWFRTTSVTLTISAFRADSVKGTFQMQARSSTGTVLNVTNGEFAIPHWKAS
jgi:hypothetical protein